MMLSVKQVVVFAVTSVIFSLLLLRTPPKGIYNLSLSSASETSGGPSLLSSPHDDGTDDSYDDSFSNMTEDQLLREYKNTNGSESGGTSLKVVDTASWTTLMKERFAARLLRLKAACRRHGASLAYSVYKTLRRNLFYSKSYKLMVCAVAKAGSTTWKSHLLAIGNKTILPQRVHDIPMLRASKQLGIEGTRVAMQSTTTTRVMTVRHPLDRLVSAYRDKFYDGAPMPADSSFSQEALKDLARQGERGMVSFTFTEFLTHVLMDQKEDKMENAHWRNFYRTCSPCSLHYDFIMNTETFSEDLKFIVDYLGATEVHVDWKLHTMSHNSASAQYVKYYTNITHALLKRVYNKYKVDFQMFGYEIPAILKAVLN